MKHELWPLKKPLAKLIFVNVPVSDVKKGRDFYSALFGTPFARSLHNDHKYHAPISNGVHIDISEPYAPQQPLMITLGVANLEESLTTIKKNGGKILEKGLSLILDPKYKAAISEVWEASYGAAAGNSMGNAAVVMDPFGSVLCLIQMEDWAEKAFESGHLNLQAQGFTHGSAMKVSTQLFEE